MVRSRWPAFAPDESSADADHEPDHEAEDLPPAERVHWRRLLLRLGSPQAAREVLYARASAASRQRLGMRPALFQHAAASHELAFAISGRAQVAVSEQVFTLAPGTMLVLEPGVYHAELPADPDREYTMCWSIYDRTRALVNESHYLPPRRLKVMGVHLRGHTDVESIVSAAAAELWRRQPGYQRAMRHLLGYLATILVRRLERGVVQRYRDAHTIVGDPRRWRYIEQALAFCRENFRDGIMVSNVARAVGLSPHRLGRLVASHLGISLSQYLLDLRMAEARSLLAARDLSIRDIARAVGYAYPEHFTRAFTRTVGLSPRAYRQHLAGE